MDHDRIDWQSGKPREAIAEYLLWRGAVEVPSWLAFVISFVVIDYAYYWNHRLLHGALWRWHAVHHTASRLDVVVTSRNTLWTPLLNAAKAKGARVMTGRELAIYQAADAFELFTGLAASRAVMGEAFDQVMGARGE